METPSHPTTFSVLLFTAENCVPLLTLAEPGLPHFKLAHGRSYVTFFREEATEKSYSTSSTHLLLHSDV